MPATFSFLSGSLALEDRPYHVQVAEFIQAALAQSHGYMGYKLTTLGRASEDEVPSFLIVTREYGIVILDVVEERITGRIEAEGAEYWTADSGASMLARTVVAEIYEEEVQSRLKNDLKLYDRKARRVKTPIRSAVVLCSNDQETIEEVAPAEERSVEVFSVDALDAWLKALEATYNCTDAELGRVYSLLEGTFVYETKHSPVLEEKLDTVNDYIQKSLRTTFRQDETQRLAAMQLPPGPQRIRGLAGTGKTIVLCMKAALTHKRFPNFRVLYLFNTQSLYSHVQGLISKYYTLEAKKPPDFDTRIDVLHAWGGRQKPGLYSKLCEKYGLVPLTLIQARGMKGDALQFVYSDLLKRAGGALEPEYDLVLIDEAQDFPNEVFQVAFKLAKGAATEKRIIWAYDEFQSLRDADIKGPSELFGVDADGDPNLRNDVLEGTYAGDIPKDFVLPNCYRTPRPVLMTAHGVAMGLYSATPTEMFYKPSDWEAIGYRVLDPHKLVIEPKDNVLIERPDENSRNLLESLMRGNGKRYLQLVQAHAFNDDANQLRFLGAKITKLITEDGVAPEEIIVINLQQGNNKNSMMEIQRALNVVNVRSVIPGYIESADVFKPPGSVTITTPFRAKGNEANIVFVLNAQQVTHDITFRMRNAFFVAVTRSRGWCYITGYGPGMEALRNEIDSIKQDFPRFKFVAPDPAAVRRARSILDKPDRDLDKFQEILDFLDKNPELRQLVLDRGGQN